MSPSSFQNDPLLSSPRFVELDAWRGLAVLAMVVFHFVFDLIFFLGTDINVYSGFWFWFARGIAGSFLFLAGLSIPLALHRKQPRDEKKHVAKRGLFLLTIGLGITLVTCLLFPTYTIWFGVLHCLGVSTLISIFFLHRSHAAILFGILIWWMGVLFSLHLLPFPPVMGLFPVAFTTFDYFPLFPWLGVFLTGMGMSSFLYPQGKPCFPLSIPPNTITFFLVGCGRHSLAIYLIHQPILVGILLAFKPALLGG